MRTWSAPALAVLSGPNPPLVLFLELGFSTVIRQTSAAVDIDWNGFTWQRTGNLGSVDAVKDSGGQITGLKFAISGVPVENIALALGTSARGKSCKLWVAVLDPATHAVLDTALMFTGMCDQLPINLQPPTATIGATAIHIGQLFRRKRTLSQTQSMQDQLYPNDRSRRFLVSQANHKDVWPAASFFRQ